MPGSFPASQTHYVLVKWSWFSPVAGGKALPEVLFYWLFYFIFYSHPHTLYTHFRSPVTHWMQRWKLGVVWPFHLVKMLGAGLCCLDTTMTFWIQDDYIISIKVTVTGLFLYNSLIQAVRHGGTWWFLCGSFLFQPLYFQVRGHGPLPVDAGYLNAPLERD